MKFKEAASKAVAVTCALVLSSSCATLLKGRTEEVMINSDPSGAQVSINDQSNGTTPYVTTSKSSEVLYIHVSKPGYQPQEITDDTSFRWGYEIWSFICYVIPLGIDMADGAAWGHDQTMIAVHLEPIAQPAPTAAFATPPAPPADQSQSQAAAVRAPDQPNPPAAANPNLGDQWKSSDHPN